MGAIWITFMEGMAFSLITTCCHFSNPDAVSYHVAKGRYYADDLTTGVTLKSVYNNEDMYISRSSYGVSDFY